MPVVIWSFHVASGPQYSNYAAFHWKSVPCQLKSSWYQYELGIETCLKSLERISFSWWIVGVKINMYLLSKAVLHIAMKHFVRYLFSKKVSFSCWIVGVRINMYLHSKVFLSITMNQVLEVWFTLNTTFCDLQHGIPDIGIIYAWYGHA